MQSNIPTVLFINKSSYLFREKFQDYVDKFVKMKIMFYSPKDAASHLNDVYENIELWWEDESIQKLRSQFVQEYALTSENWMDEWCSKLKCS